LVKLRLPADLVRAMDQAILQSRGAYLDRNEYVAEAIRDRLTEEEGLAPAEPAPAMERSVLQVQGPLATPRVAASAPEWGRWRGTSIPTSSARPVGGVNFGLHNRDYPTLWALNELAARVAELGAPVKWRELTARLRKQAQATGAWLRARDAEQPSMLKIATGFPKTGEKARASEDRFLTASVGTVNRNGVDGPFFLLGLASLTPDGERVLPTSEGLDVLGALIDAGLRDSLPQSPAAFRVWWRHIASLASEEHECWVRLLKAIAQQPNRAELLVEFPEWTGSRAETNCMGLVSRSREWSLVTNELADGRYQLTDLGHQVVERGGKL
jgi:hypothetical protein